MIEGLASIFGSAGFGSVVGGVFGWLNRKEERKELANQREFELKRISAAANADQQASDARSFEESQKTVSALGGAIKSAVRPLITGVLLWQTYIILTSLEQITGGIINMPEGEALQLYREITLNIISLTATSVSWWFASRPSNKAKA